MTKPFRTILITGAAGMSDNTVKPVDMQPATHRIGGWFVTLGHPDDEEAR